MDVSTVSLDLESLESEELLARRLEAIAAVPLSQFQPEIPQGLSTDSSIKQASKVEQASTSFRPVLEEPKAHFMYGLIQTHNKLESVADKQSRLFEIQVKQDIAEIERLDAEALEKVRKAAEATKSEQTWGTLSHVSQYLLSGSTAILGVSLLPAAPWVGGALLVSAGLNIGRQILHDTGTAQTVAAWFTASETLQKKIGNNIEMGMMFLSLGFGLGGGAWAHNLGLLAAANKAADVQKVITGIGLGSMIGKGVGDMGNGFAQKRNAHMQADLQTIQVQREQLYQRLQQESREVDNFIGTVGDITSELKQAISASVVHQD